MINIPSSRTRYIFGVFLKGNSDRKESLAQMKEREK